MASRNVQYIHYYTLDGFNDISTIGIFIPELAQIGQNIKEVNKKLKKLARTGHEEAKALSKKIEKKTFPKDGYFKLYRAEDMRGELSDIHSSEGFYTILSKAGIALPGNIQENEMNLHVKGKLPEGVFCEVSHFHVRYQHKPLTIVEKHLPKMGYALAAITALGLAMLAAQGIMTGGLAGALMAAIGVGTLYSRYTHILGVAQNKLSRLGAAYSRFASGLYRKQSWGDKWSLFKASVSTSTFLTGVMWGAVKFFEASLKLFNYPLAMLYTGASLLYNLSSVIDPVLASSGLYKTRPIQLFEQEKLFDYPLVENNDEKGYESELESENEYESESELVEEEDNNYAHLKKKFQ